MFVIIRRVLRLDRGFEGGEVVAGDVDDRVEDLRGVWGLGPAGGAQRAVQGDCFPFSRHCEFDLQYLLGIYGCN